MISLLASATINLNSTDPQEAYVVPTMKLAIPVFACWHHPSPEPFINGNSGELILEEEDYAAICETRLGPNETICLQPTLIEYGHNLTGGKRIMAHPNLPYNSGSGQTAIVDIWGYLVDEATGIFSE